MRKSVLHYKIDRHYAITRQEEGIIKSHVDTLRTIKPPCWVSIRFSNDNERNRMYFAGYENYAGEKRAKLFRSPEKINGNWDSLASLSHPATVVD